MDRGGPLIGLLMGLGQLSQTELVLKEIVCQNGLLGVEKCIAVGFHFLVVVVVTFEVLTVV